MEVSLINKSRKLLMYHDQYHMAPSNSSNVLNNEVLVLPKPKKKTESKRRGGLNTKAIYITDNEALGELKAKR